MTHTEVLEFSVFGARFFFTKEPMPAAAGQDRYFVDGKATCCPTTRHGEGCVDMDDLVLDFALPSSIEDEKPWIPMEYEKPTQEDHLWLNANLMPARQLSF